MDSTIIKRGFNPVFKSIKTPDVSPLTGNVIPRNWQVQFDHLRNQSPLKNTIINSPGGAGKSRAIAFSEIKKLISDKTRKVIIAAPQKGIGGNFSQFVKFEHEGKTFEWFVEQSHDLCTGVNNDSKTNLLIRFMIEEPLSRPCDRIMVCTHATLAQSFARMNREGLLDKVKNTFLWIDEAHHIVQTDEFCNDVGKVVKYFLDHQEAGLNVGLSTASFFRGDKLPIVSSESDELFYTYKLPYDKHFEENCRYMKSFVYDFILSKLGWLDSIKTLFKESVDKTIVFIPHPNAIVSTGNKIQEVERIISAIAGVETPEMIDREDGTIVINRDGKEVVIIDLVDDRNEKLRDKREDFVRRYPEKVDVIINLFKFTEGADWPEANRAIVVGNRGSLTQLIQIISRVFRDHPSKLDKPVKIYQVFSWVDIENLEKGEVKDNINNYMKGIYSSLIMESIICPPDIKLKSLKESENDFDFGRSDDTILYKLREVLTEHDYFQFVEESIEELALYRSNNPDIPNEKITEKYKEVLMEFFVDSVVSDKGLDEHFSELSDFIIAICERRTKNQMVFPVLPNVNDIEFNAIREIDPIGFILGYTNDVCGIHTLKDYRHATNLLEAIWNENYENVKKFVSSNNRYPSCRSENKREKSLGTWCSDQRKYYDKNTLSENRIKLLESLPHWKWDVLGDNWNETYENVKKFISENNRYPKQNLEDESEDSLGCWCVSQRGSYDKNTLSENRIKLLESLPHWKWDIFEDNWSETYENIKKFVSENKRYPNSNSNDKSEKSLGIWCKNQRTSYKKNILSEERIKLLEFLPNWKWDIIGDNWNETYENIKRSVSENNRYPNSNSNDKSEKSLGNWLLGQRKSHKKNTLSEERIKLLESLPYWKWDIFEANWSETYENIKKFISENNRYPNKRSENESEKSLGIWCSCQRKSYNKNTLSENRIKLLESLTSWKWDVLEDNWSETYENIKKFVSENNRYPNKDSINESEKSLGNWCSCQRKSHKKNTLSEERKKLLEFLPDWKWDIIGDNWNKNYENVKKFVSDNSRYPNCRSENEFEKSLGYWLSDHRKSYNKNILSANRIKLLESLPHWKWDVIVDNWNDNYENLKKFISENNRYPIQRSNSESEQSLGNWYKNQRTYYYKKLLSEERIKLLESLPNWKWSEKRTSPEISEPALPQSKDDCEKRLRELLQN